MQKNSKQYFSYMIFAVFAIMINILIQIISKEILILFFFEFSNNYIQLGKVNIEYWFIFALGFGTLSGFIIKFILDKFVVFEEKRNTISTEETGKQLSLYLGFAIITTMIFWGFQFGFKLLFPGDWYLIGGIIGLAIGYTVKFLLDRKYVFNQNKVILN